MNISKFNSKRLDGYAAEGTVVREILDRHFLKSMPPSEIDKELKLLPGTAHDEVVKYWDYCNPNPKKVDDEVAAQV